MSVSKREPESQTFNWHRAKPCFQNKFKFFETTHSSLSSSKNETYKWLGSTNLEYIRSLATQEPKYSQTPKMKRRWNNEGCELDGLQS
jgi:hypothetical protein